MAIKICTFVSCYLSKTTPTHYVAGCRAAHIERQTGQDCTCISTYFVYASVGVRAEAGSGAPSELALPANVKHGQRSTLHTVNAAYSWTQHSNAIIV